MGAEVRPQVYYFRDFELDLAAYQLRCRGEPVRLERRPLELLILLVSRQGELVKRDEIIAELWPSKVVIDFDTGLNTLVRKVRQALRDSSDRPVFVETVPGRGYRFVAPVRSETPPPARSPLVSESTSRSRSRTPFVWIAIALLVVAGVVVQVWRIGPGSGGPIGVAVLPFTNLTGSAEFDYLAAGLAEDTRASLAQIDMGNLRLVGQISARASAASEKPVQQLGRELGVDFVVTSSLRAESSRLRVTSQLVRVSDNEQVWAAAFDRELTGLLGLQRELSIAIAEQVRLKLSPEVTATIARRQTPNPEAYDLYLRGRYHWGWLNPAGNRQALQYFERAIAEDPRYALAWAGIAQVLSTAPITGDAEPGAVAARARDAVERAVEYGAGLAETQYALGYYNFFLAWDWPGAEQALRNAVSLDPNSAIAHLMLGHVLSQTGNQAEARAEMRRARELDPFFSHTFALSAQVAYQGRDFSSELELARQAIAINPEGWVGYVQLGQALSELGQTDEAIRAYEQAERYSGGNSKTIAFRAQVQARNGRVDDARAALESLRARANERYVPPYTIAIIHAGLSESDAAFDWLERAYAARDVHLVFLPVDVRWDAMRGDARFQALIERCGF